MVTACCALIFGVIPVLSKQVTVTTEKYEIWPGSFRIGNGVVDLVVVPQVGRIMRLGEVGSRNVLWEGERVDGLPPAIGAWKNWGGDKVWPAPQDAWGWPPEPEYDGAAWDVQAVPNGVHMVSKKASGKLGVRFERTILLQPGANSAEIRNTLINDSGKTARLAVWQVCQVDDPEECILAIWKSKKHPNGWKVYGEDKVGGLVTEDGGDLRIRRDPDRALKYGTGSPKGSLSAVVGAYRVELSALFDEGAEYPDGGNAQQVYTSPNPTRYAELELAGPLTTLAPGQSTSITVTIKVKRNRTYSALWRLVGL